LAGLLRQAESPRRRRQVMVAGVAFVAVAAAVIGYVVDQRRFEASLSKIELPDVVAKRTAAPPSAERAPDLTAPPASALASGASSPEPTSPPPTPGLANSPVRSAIENATESQDRATKQVRPADKALDGVDAQPELPTAANAASSSSRTPPPCSDPAAALGLCDAEISSPTRRQ